MEDTTTRLQGHVHPDSYRCGRCGRTPTGGLMRPRRGLIPEGVRCEMPQGGGGRTDMSTSRYRSVQGGRRWTWSRFATWSVLLLTLLNTVTRTTQQSTTTATPRTGCFQTFKANVSTDVFRGACEDITFPCNGPLTKLQKINPTADCSRWFDCADKIIYDCPCAAGTRWNATVGACVESFYANCTCPDGRGPPQSTTTTPKPLVGDNTALIAGVVVGVVVIIILIIVIVLLMKRRQAQKARPMTPTLGPQYSVKSMNYEDINDLKRGDDPNIYDNGPSFEVAEYDNHGFRDKDAIRPRTQNATVTSTTSTLAPPPLPGGHPTSTKSMANGIKDEEEPEYMETLE